MFWSRCWRWRCRPARRIAASLPRMVSMNVCTDQLLLTLADPEQILGIEPVFAGRLAIAGAATSAAIRCCPEEPRTCCCIKPDIVVASAVRQALDAGAVEGQGASSRRTRRAANARRSAAADPRGRRHHRASRSRGGGNRAARCGAGARAPRGLRSGIIACCRCRGAAGWRAATVLSARCSAKPGCCNAAGDLGFAFGGFASLEAIVSLRPDFIVVSQAGDHCEG